MEQNRQILKGYLFVILSAVLFGLMPLMAKFIYSNGVNSLSLVLLRNLLSVPFLLLLSFLTRRTIKIKVAVLPKISFIALMGCCITPLLLFSSYNHIPSGTATVFHFIYPAVVVLGEYIFLKKKIGFLHMASVVLCVIGIMFFYNPNDTINFKGSFFALLSGVTYAIYIMCLSNFKNREISGFTFSLYIASISSIIMMFVCILTNQLMIPNSSLGWGLTLLFSLSVNVGAVVLFQKGTFLIGGGRSSVLSSLEPATSIFAGVIVFREEIDAFTVLGSILVILATVFIAVNDIKIKKNT